MQTNSVILCRLWHNQPASQISVCNYRTPLSFLYHHVAPIRGVAIFTLWLSLTQIDLDRQWILQYVINYRARIRCVVCAGWGVPLRQSPATRVCVWMWGALCWQVGSKIIADSLLTRQLSLISQAIVWGSVWWLAWCGACVCVILCAVGQARSKEWLTPATPLCLSHTPTYPNNVPGKDITWPLIAGSLPCMMTVGL